jgi:hypothetical protein
MRTELGAISVIAFHCDGTRLVLGHQAHRTLFQFRSRT